MVATNQADLSTITSVNQISPLSGGQNWSAGKDVSRQVVDTIASYVGASQKQKEKAASGKPVLIPVKKGKKSTDYMKVLDEAYAAIFNEDAKGLQEQVHQEAQDQQLVQTMSKMMLISTNKAVKEELKEAKLITKAYNEEKHENEISSIMTDIFSLGITPLLKACGVSSEVTKWVTLGVGIGVALAALAFTIATGGAGAAVEVAADTELAADVGGAAADGVDAGSDAEAGSDVEDSDDESDDGEGLNSTLGTQGSGVSGEQMEAELGKTSEEIGDENVTSVSKFRKAAASLFKSLGKRTIGMTVAGVFQSPELFQGVASLKLAGYKLQVAEIQKNLAPETANIGLNQAIFRFYQKLIQQSTSVIQGLGEQLGNVLQTYATINNDYRDIATGLNSAA